MNLPQIDQEKSLSKNEQGRLAELEAVIVSNLKGYYVKVGRALAEIRDSRLYRSDGSTFEEYLHKIWDMPFQRAYQLINSAEVTTHLETFFGPEDENSTIVEFLPINEAQVRPLVPLTLEEQVTAWQLVRKRAQEKNTKVTSALVKRCVQEMKGERLKNEIKKDLKETSRENGWKISEQLEQSFIHFLGSIQKEMDANWRYTSKDMVVRHLRTLLAAVEGL